MCIRDRYEEHRKNSRHPSVAYELAETLDAMMVQEVRCTVPGHFQRGGEPCPYDRVSVSYTHLDVYKRQTQIDVVRDEDKEVPTDVDGMVFMTPVNAFSLPQQMTDFFATCPSFKPGTPAVVFVNQGRCV